MSENDTFNKWNIEKQKLDRKKSRKTIKERDVLFLSIGKNIGFEQNGKGSKFLRPVLVFKKFSKQVFIGIPLTSKEKIGQFYFSFTFKNKNSTAILSQIRLFDTKRISYYYGRIGYNNYIKLKEKLIQLFR